MTVRTLSLGRKKNIVRYVTRRGKSTISQTVGKRVIEFFKYTKMISGTYYTGTNLLHRYQLTQRLSIGTVPIFEYTHTHTQYRDRVQT